MRARLRDRWLMAALALAVGAFALNEVGVGVGLPYHYHWDEPTIVNRAIRMGSGDLNPHFFYYPALLLYLLFILDGGLFVVGHVSHAYPSITAFAAGYFTNSTAFYLIGRTLVALFGAGCVLLCYAVGKCFFNRGVGLLGALFLAISPEQVSSAHFITNDVPMSFFVLLAYLGIWAVYTHGRRRDYVLAGVAIGLAIAVKYLPVLLLVSLGLAHVFRIRRETGRWRPQWSELKPLALGFAASFFAFFIASPFVILDFADAIRDYAQQGAISSASGSTTASLNLVPYLTQTLGWSLGWPMYLLGIAGCAAFVRLRGERLRQLIMFASFPVLYFAAIGLGRQPFARYLVPVMPFLVLSAAASAIWCARHAPVIWERLRWGTAYRRSALIGGALGALVLICAVLPFINSVRYDAYLTMPNSQTLAAEWFDTHVPAGTMITIESIFDRYFFTAPVMTSGQLQKLESDIPASQLQVLALVDSYYRSQGVYPDVPFVYNLVQLRAEGVRYAIISSLDYHATADIVGQDRFYAELRAQARVAAQFAPPTELPDAANYPVSMPTITIYALS